MSLKHHSFTLVAAVAFLSCYIVEARRFPPIARPENNENDLNSLFSHPDVRTKVLDMILQSRGSSIEQIHNKIAAADGNLEVVVSEINSELKTDAIKIDGDRIRINPDELKTLLKDGVQAVLREKLSNNPSLASVVEESVNKHFADNSDQLDEIISKNTIPLDSARRFLETHGINRSKRSLQSRDFDLTQIISDIVANLLHSQLSSIIWDLLENLKNTVVQLRINTTPSNDIERVISYAVNTLVSKGVELITVIQENIKPTNSTTESPVSRKRRAAEDTTATPDDGSNNNDVQDTTQGQGGGLLDILIRPLMALISLLLSPLRLLLKFVVNLLVTVLNPILGDVLTSSISDLLNTIIDTLVPSFLN